MLSIDQINQGGTIYEIVPEIAELFSTTKTYHTGDHVIYEAGWYTFKADKTAGAWDATKVDGPFKVTKQLSDLKEDLDEQVDELKNALVPNNSFDLIPFSFNGTNGANAGVTYSFGESGTCCTLTGTATAVSARNVLNYTANAFPYGMEPGKTYVIEPENVNADIFVRFFFMNGSSNISGQNYKITEKTYVTVPASGCDGCLFRVEVKNGTVTNRTIRYKILNVDSLQEVYDEVKADRENTIKLLKNGNAYDYMRDIFNGVNATKQNITFTFNNKNECTLSGTASENVSQNIISYVSDTLPSALSAGKSYVINAENIDTDIYLRLFFMNGSSIAPGHNYPITSTPFKFTIPVTGVNGIVLRIEVRSGAITNKTIKFSFLNTYSNQNLTEMLENVIDGYGDYYAFGDSLTIGSVNSTHIKPDIVYPEMVAKVCNLTLHNMGIGGQGLVMSQGGEKTLAYETVSETDISNAKLITLAWGTNDTPSSALGTASDTSGAETVAGQMKAILDYIFTNNPACQVVILGMPRSSLDFDENGAGGWSRNDFQSLMETIGASYCVPVVSYKQCSICNEANWLAVTSSTDRVHPSNEAYYITSAYLAGQISRYFLS